MVQYSALDDERFGDLDPFLRYDLVSLGQRDIGRRGWQQALRTGFNYNLPYTGKLVNLHVEFAHSTASGPTVIINRSRTVDEFRVELRVSLQQYTRH
jgi:hypothetical protein